MKWTHVALLLLVVGFVFGGLAITVFVWSEFLTAYKHTWGLVVSVSGIISVIALLSSFVIINKKL